MASKQPPTPRPKLFQCQLCPRQFATEAATNAHSRDTGHLIPCTIVGCQRGFVSHAALTAHLATATHPLRKNVTKKTPKIEKTKQVNPAPQGSTHAEPSKLLRHCTAPGCIKSFKTHGALSQHLESPAHKEINQATTQKAVQDVCPAQQSGVPCLPTAAEPAVIVGGQINKGRKVVGSKGVTVPVGEGGVRREGVNHVPKPTTQTGKNAVRAKKAAPPPNLVQPSPVGNIEPPKREPLFRWDTRWSGIPTTARVSTLIALKAEVPAPETFSSANIKKVPQISNQKRAPAQAPGLQKSLAIALDCEMVGTGPKGSISSLARLSAVDFLTGELLIDSLVRPQSAVTDWRTKYSGITAAAMSAAIQSNDVLDGSAAARAELFKYMDIQTVLVGHALHHDLAALGIRHTEIVDSEVLAKKAVGGQSKRGWGLKTLCKDLLGVVVQDGEKEGHDAVEDALAAREVVVWCLQHKKELKEWGARMRQEAFVNRAKGRKKQGAAHRVKARQIWCDSEDEDDYEYRNMSLREFNELCGYPEWYDNWSD